MVPPAVVPAQHCIYYLPRPPRPGFGAFWPLLDMVDGCFPGHGGHQFLFLPSMETRSLAGSSAGVLIMLFTSLHFNHCARAKVSISFCLFIFALIITGDQLRDCTVCMQWRMPPGTERMAENMFHCAPFGNGWEASSSRDHDESLIFTV